MLNEISMKQMPAIHRKMGISEFGLYFSPFLL